jgi:hypothetical protein
MLMYCLQRTGLIITFTSFKDAFYAIIRSVTGINFIRNFYIFSSSEEFIVLTYFFLSNLLEFTVFLLLLLLFHFSFSSEFRPFL